MEFDFEDDEVGAMPIFPSKAPPPPNESIEWPQSFALVSKNGETGGREEKQKYLEKKHAKLKRNKGMAIGDFWQRLVRCGFSCELCQITLVIGNKQHPHNCSLDFDRELVGLVPPRDAIRGVLCSHCRLGIYLFKDSPSLLKKAAEWVDYQRFIQEDGGC